VTSTPPPTVTVRYWAGAKAAAGVGEEQVVAATLAAALRQVREERDAHFTRILDACSYVVSERPVGRTPHDEVLLADGDIVEVLPPFAGGAEPTDRVVTAAPVPAALPSWRPPVLSALLGLGLMATAAAGPAYLWIGVAIAQLLLVASWHRALAAPDANAGAVVGALLILVADLAVAFDDGPVSYGPIAVVLGVGYLAAVVQQLARRGDRTNLTFSIAATVSLATIGALGAGWAINPRLSDGDAFTLLAATAVTAAATGRLAPRLSGALLGPMVAGTAAGVLLGSNVGEVGAGLGATIGFAVSIPATLAAVGQVRLPPRAVGWPAGAVWPVLVAAPLAYLVIRVGGH